MAGAQVCEITSASLATERGRVPSTTGRETETEGVAELLRRRRAHYGPNTSLAYEKPLNIVRGTGCILYDAAGAEYLDCVNNVAHLGHCHPEVVSAIAEQLSTLNTNSRYLHSTLVDYTQELLATMPSELQVLYMTCSGSEANDLALRIARQNRPDATHVAVMAGAYHGHTVSLIPLSSYKFWGAGGEGRRPDVHVVPCPDPYRGLNLDAREVARAVLNEARRAGGRIGAFFCESVLSCGGQIVLPQGYLQALYDEFRKAGVLCVADEVQSGFGRVGSHFWGFQSQAVVPDMVSLGKPMGNGYPVAGLVVTRALADGFCTGMEYFNTYGGGTAACTAALTVLRILQRDMLQEHAYEVGQYLVSELRALRRDFSDVIGDVRGLGLMIGIEIVRDPGTKLHAPVTARFIKERMKARRVLLSTDGPYDNVVKMKPPLVFSKGNADHMLRHLRAVLEEELHPAQMKALAVEEDAHWAAVCAPRAANYLANEVALLGHVAVPPPASRL